MNNCRDQLIAAVGNAVRNSLPGAIADEIDDIAKKQADSEKPLEAAVLGMLSGFVRENGAEGIDDLTNWLDDTLSGKSCPPPPDMSAEELTKIATLMQDAEADELRTSKRWARQTRMLVTQAMRFAVHAITA
tara:strand:+ start:39 stop:434 length:396 start_codon:yes stop_codon:yes gene_type:complete